VTEVVGGTPEELRKLQIAEIEKYKRIAQAAISRRIEGLCSHSPHLFHQSRRPGEPAFGSAARPSFAGDVPGGARAVFAINGRPR
jgi:hypothetical protein